MSAREFVDVLDELYGKDPWPKPLHALHGTLLLDSGMTLHDAARTVGTTAHRLQQLHSADDRLTEILGLNPRDIETRYRNRALATLGQLLVGRGAELAFERIYRDEMHTHELQLHDLRESRTDTDYRLYNGQGRPVYRINIKFHGALFHRAPELVGLDPHDCFALATYKINSALRKQQEEGLPYIFVVVGVRTLSGETVGAKIPSRYVDALAYLYQAPRAQGKRNFEDRVVDRLVSSGAAAFVETYERIREADWYIISARRADRLLREKLYERVFALRIPRFAQQFRSAELDMHFSLADDLIPLRRFLTTLREAGHAKVVTLLERGEY
ncbi:MAG TPA: hypothetical protein VF188_12825 [Longimicrobiales bacterium]